MSRTSMKQGSADSLKVSVRCGCSAKARQMRLTVVGSGNSGHGPGAPVRGVLGSGLQRQRNHPFHVFISNR